MPPNNFLHEENLDYLIEAVQAEMFGEPLYPTISDKAALYCYNIICNHIFTDGNKRTGLEAALVFLRLNNMRLSRVLPLNDLYHFILKTASGEVTLEQCREWFESQVVAWSVSST
jgi:death-on-curing protein